MGYVTDNKIDGNHTLSNIDTDTSSRSHVNTDNVEAWDELLPSLMESMEAWKHHVLLLLLLWVTNVLLAAVVVAAGANMKIFQTEDTWPYSEEKPQAGLDM